MFMATEMALNTEAADDGIIWYYFYYVNVVWT